MEDAVYSSKGSAVFCQGTDKLGISTKFTHHRDKHLIEVEVWHPSQPETKRMIFPAQRWGIQVADMIKAEQIASNLAREIEMEEGWT